VTKVSDSPLALLSRLWLREPDSATLAAARELPSLAPHAGDEPAAMAAAYADLFLLNVSPYGSTFTDPSGELNGPSTGRAARCYEDRGFRPPELFEVGAPDHVGLGLAFLDHLARGGETDVEFSASLLEWVPVCCLAVEREPSAHPLYEAVALLTRRRLLENLSEPPAHGGNDADPSDEGEEEMGISRIVRFLLTPARSGLYLSRAKLGQLARRAEMRLPFGSRFDVARLLFQTAGESEKVGTVLDLLGDELSEWETAYRSWADEQPHWKGVAGRWLGRTGEARRLLGRMREILESPPDFEYADESR
jgi:putative dimethyl sulfoxide reductase chaperone